MPPPQNSFTSSATCIHSKGTLIDLGEALCHSQTNVSVALLAGYTYLGQFIDHDITHTFGSDTLASGDVSPHTYVNIAKANLALTSVYASDQLQQQPGINSQSGEFQLSAVIDDNERIVTAMQADLPRDPHSKQALIPDERNDENLLVAQIHLHFLKLHNHFVRQQASALSPQDAFLNAKQQVIQAYQSIVVHDYLRTILQYDVWHWYFAQTREPLVAEQRLAQNLFYQQGVPREFSGAAFRFGHSMVREKYRLNATTEATLAELFQYTGRARLNGRSHLPLSHVVELSGFFEPGALHEQKANDIRPHIGIILPHFEWPANCLAVRNLFRAQTLGLPSAQFVLEYVQRNLPEALGNELDWLSAAEINHPLLDSLGHKTALQQSTPLLFYVLLEAYKKGRSRTLGPLASIIIAETFFNLLGRDKNGQINLPNADFNMRKLIAITKSMKGASHE